MKQTNFKKILACCFCLVAIAALLLTGCVSEIHPTEAQRLDSGQLGEGDREFCLTVIHADGTERKFEIHTDKETVGAALLEVGLIDGEDSEYGLYIKIVNGEALDFDKDGKYWAFYIDDAYASVGVDSAIIDPDCSYVLKAE